MRPDNLQLPHITSNSLMVAIVIMVAMVMLVMVVKVNMVVRRGQNCHLNLTFQVNCEWQLSQFLRCFIDMAYIVWHQLNPHAELERKMKKKLSSAVFGKVIWPQFSTFGHIGSPVFYLRYRCNFSAFLVSD